MSTIKQGDRIDVTDSSKQRYRDSGTVRKIVPSGFPFLGDKAEIEFDDGTVEDNFPVGALAIKIVDSQEAMNEVEKIEKIIDRISVPEREKKELPTHLDYLKQDIKKSNKPFAMANFFYVDKTLEALNNTKSSSSWLEEIEPSLRKIRNWLNAGKGNA